VCACIDSECVSKVRHKKRKRQQKDEQKHQLEKGEGKKIEG